MLKGSYTVRYPSRFYVYPAELFPGLEIYSGIFAIYLRFASKDSRTKTIVLYALCLHYVLSTAAVVGDLISSISDSDVSDNSICKNIIYLLVMADASQYTSGSTSN